MQGGHGERRGEQRADEEEPQAGGEAEVLHLVSTSLISFHYHYHHNYYYEAVREESPREDPEGSPEDGCAEGPGADVEVRVVVLEEVAGVVRPAVASRVAEEG